MNTDVHRVALSEKGWTSDYIGLQWFEKLFVPQAKEKNITEKPILLIYDGHHSHASIELCKAAVEANIKLFTLPPHTSHRLQPLDVGVFGPLQRAWQKQCSVVRVIQRVDNLICMEEIRYPPIEPPNILQVRFCAQLLFIDKPTIAGNIPCFALAIL